ncbi:2013_t:CDS:2 [Funneliformis geosporum]|uniref:2013_t:CDS:1 n=1 Tax=Funneliformis geosporum TaxID=1117311 RepID=A0A9W4T2N1_9GLOM|nr:2013_t:CDS:2 [Funneliformis geosporum]
MNDNRQVQGYNCDGCSRSIPSGQEAPRFVMKMTEAPNFEGYMNNKHFSENTKGLAKELEED